MFIFYTVSAWIRELLVVPKPPESKSTLCFPPKKIADKVGYANRPRIIAEYFN
jgi:hypothetical protein